MPNMNLKKDVYFLVNKLKDGVGAWWACWAMLKWCGLHFDCPPFGINSEACFATFFPDMCTERLFGVKITDQREGVPAHRRTGLLLWAVLDDLF
jgi:hypothetical protein